MDSNTNKDRNKDVIQFIKGLFSKLPKPFTVINGRMTFLDKYPVSWQAVVTYGMDTDFEVLKQYWRFRKRVVGYLLDTIISRLKCTDCTYHSVGSETYTSDHDVSVFGSHKEDIVIRFNKLFVLIFGGESGEVFDTNIYGVTSLIPVKNGTNNRTKNGTNSSKSYTYVKSCSKKRCQTFKYIKIPKGVTVDISNQRSWAFVKLFRYLTTKGEISKFVNKAHKMGIKLLKADTENSLERYRQVLKAGDPNDLSQMNNNYNILLMRVKRARKQMESHPKNLLYKINYKDAESQANYFSQDAYYTQGAYNHSVGLLQIGINSLEVTNNELIDSCIENTGGLVKELNDLQAKIKDAKEGVQKGTYLRRSMSRVSFDDQQFVHAVIKISKYWMRILDAVTKIQYKVTDFNLRSYDRDTIKKALKDTEHLRREMRGRKLSSNCKSVECVSIELAVEKIKQLLHMFNIKKYSLKLVRHTLVEFLLEVLEAHYSGTKTGVLVGGAGLWALLFGTGEKENKQTNVAPHSLRDTFRESIIIERDCAKGLIELSKLDREIEKINRDEIVDQESKKLAMEIAQDAKDQLLDDLKQNGCPEQSGGVTHYKYYYYKYLKYKHKYLKLKESR